MCAGSTTGWASESLVSFCLVMGRPSMPLNYPADEVVLLCLSNLDVDKLSGLGREAFGRVVDEDAAVDVGRLRLHATLPEQVGLFRHALEEHADDTADARAVLLQRDARLRAHQFGAALACDLRVNLAGKVEGRRALLVRVGEDADAVELDVPDEG